MLLFDHLHQKLILHNADNEWQLTKNILVAPCGNLEVFNKILADNGGLAGAADGDDG